MPVSGVYNDPRRVGLQTVLRALLEVNRARRALAKAGANGTKLAVRMKAVERANAAEEHLDKIDAQVHYHRPQEVWHVDWAKRARA